MKQFEKWFEKKQAGYSHAVYYTDKYEEGWKEALKWALLTGSWEIVAQEIKEEIYKTDAKT